MFGAILGDIIGQPYEFDRGHKTKEFPLFSKHPHFTDDSVMTIAICDGILKAGLDADENTMKTSMITSMQLWGGPQVSSCGIWWQILSVACDGKHKALQQLGKWFCNARCFCGLAFRNS